MLTVKEEQSLVADLSPSQRRKFSQDQVMMMKAEPVAGITQLINFKAREFGIKPTTLIEELVHMKFCEISRRPLAERFSRYNYTCKWFDYYLGMYVIQNPFRDFFGEHLLSFGTNLDKKNFGQCMTPFDLAQVLATLATSRETSESVLPRRISDFCCGTGSMVLANLGQVKANTIEVYVNDIDSVMVEMCHVQLFYNTLLHLPEKNVSVYSYCSNAITEYNTKDGKSRLYAYFRTSSEMEQAA